MSEPGRESPLSTRRTVLASGAAGALGLAAPSPARAQTGAGDRTGPGSPPSRRFAGKAVLVTGATSGIGRASAIAFAREGAKVVFCGRRKSLGREVEREIRQTGGEATYVRADMRVPEEIERLVAATLSAHGRIDVAFNNAGIGQTGSPTHEVTLAQWDDVMNTNLRGLWLCMRQELPIMVRQGGGVIVNCASVASFAGLRNGAEYAVTKHGIMALTRSAALEYGPQGVRVVAVAPGPVDTELWRRALPTEEKRDESRRRAAAQRRAAAPEEIAAGVLWLAEGGASFAAGTALVLDGGFLAV